MPVPDRPEHTEGAGLPSVRSTRWLQLLASIRPMHLLDPRSLQVQLTLLVWLLLIVLFSISNLLQWSSARAKIVAQVGEELKADSDYLAYGVKRWTMQMRRLQWLLSQDLGVQSLHSEASASLLQRIHLAYPERLWRLYDREGHLVAATGSPEALSEPKRQRLITQRSFQRALAGRSSHEVLHASEIGQNCLMFATPIYPPSAKIANWQVVMDLLGSDEPSPGARTGPPVGVMVTCLRLQDIGSESGLSDLANTVNTVLNAPSTTNDRIRLDQGDPTGTAFLLMSTDGDLLFPTDTLASRRRPLTPQQVRSGPWGAFVEAVNRSPYARDFRTIRLGGQSYLVYTNQVDPIWRIALVVDQQTAFQLTRSLLAQLIPLQLLIMLISAVVIFWACSRAARPVQRAGRAIRRLADGDFEVNLPLDRRDEIGNLYRDIHETGSLLRQYIAEETAYAVTRQQIATARAIQLSFLVETLPSSEHIELAASFNPALDVAGDWYDAIPIDDSIYVVVADVCDKGVGAALFMSVFRTLLRYEILRRAAEPAACNGGCLAEVVTQVNEYMASNHANSTMFATLFVACCSPSAGSLHYVCAGHELPLLLRRDPASPLERLGVNGPAIGIFPGASYQVSELPFASGDLLFAYTDGLTDARSPQGEAWNGHRLVALLSEAHADGLTAPALLDRLLVRVRAHMGSADPFDDLTMLALRLR